MPARARLEGLAAATLLVACAAFVVSFAVGLGGFGRTTAAVVPATTGYTQPTRTLGRVEVLNASGRAGLARAATRRLRDEGFDVVYFGNASGFDGDSSVVLARTSADSVARAAARGLGIRSVRAAPDETLLLDATVVIGRDWAAADSVAAEPADARWWQRVGRWLRPSL
jgi:hypothetical protein